MKKIILGLIMLSELVFGLEPDSMTSIFKCDNGHQVSIVELNSDEYSVHGRFEKTDMKELKVDLKQLETNGKSQRLQLRYVAKLAKEVCDAN